MNVLLKCKTFFQKLMINVLQGLSMLVVDNFCSDT